jgi:hypothetical protein
MMVTGHSQPANSIYAENVLKMFSRMPAKNRARAVWVINQDVEPLLPQMSVKIKNVAGTENVGGLPVYVPPGGLTGAQYGTLLGRPIVMTESAAALSSLGDISLCDFNEYIAITKGAVRAEQSMHFWFDQNLRAFRFILRVGGQPWLSAAMARKNGFAPSATSVATYRREYMGRWRMTEAQFADKMDEEAVARLFGDYVSVRDRVTPWVRKVVDKLLEWADAVLQVMGAAGIDVQARQFMR